MTSLKNEKLSFVVADVVLEQQGKFTINTKKAPTLVAGMNLPKKFKNLLKIFSLYYIIKYIKEQKNI